MSGFNRIAEPLSAAEHWTLLLPVPGDPVRTGSISMDIPIQRQGSCLIASIPAALVDEDLTHLRDQIVEQVRHCRLRGVIVDVTGLDVVDSFATRTLGDLAANLRLRGAEMVIVGIQPDVAVAVARFGLTFEAVATVVDKDAGLDYLNGRARSPDKRRGASH
jgi:rsbT antagonist protein RsbS